MSDFEAVTDALVARVQDIPGLEAAKVFRYAPMAPEELQPNAGRCLAVWPNGESVESAETFTYGDVLVRQPYTVVVWEATSDAERQTTDEEGLRVLLDIANGLRAALITKDLLDVPGVMDVAYTGCRINTRAGQVRWVEASVTVTSTTTYGA